jgi:hypothetical protein
MDEWIAHTIRVHDEIALNLQGLLRGRSPADLTGAEKVQEMYVGESCGPQPSAIRWHCFFAPNS